MIIGKAESCVVFEIGHIFIEEVGNCTICLEELQGSDKKVVSLACKHFYHEGCMEVWLVKEIERVCDSGMTSGKIAFSERCPNCREQIENKLSCPKST
jgi:hypothetical protein